MLNSKAAEILRTLSPDELKSFRNYIISPFHNTNKNVVKLFELSRRYSPAFASPLLSKEKLFKKLYPGKKYSDIVMRILLSDLLRLAEEFLAYIRYVKNPATEKKYLLEELKNRGIDRLFSKHVKEAEKYQEKEGSIHSGYFLDLYEIEDIKVNYLISKDRQGETGGCLSKKGEYLVNFFILNILNIADELNELKEVLNENFSFNPVNEFIESVDLEKVINYYRKNNYRYTPILEIYYYMYKSSVIQSGNKYYDLLKDAITNNLHLFTREEQYNLFLILESSLLTQLRAGRKKGNDELLNLYKQMLSSNIFSLSETTYMQANLFRNIFYTALLFKEYDWAEKFVSDYHHMLVPEQKEGMFNYTNAMLNFERKNYGAALEYVSKINYTFFIYKFDAKALSLKIHYEMRSFEPALSLIDSFAHFLSRNRNVTEYYRESFMNFNKYLKQLIRFSIDKKASGKNYQETDIHSTVKSINNCNSLMYKRWLLEKMNELST